MLWARLNPQTQDTLAHYVPNAKTVRQRWRPRVARVCVCVCVCVCARVCKHRLSFASTDSILVEPSNLGICFRSRPQVLRIDDSSPFEPSNL